MLNPRNCCAHTKYFLSAVFLPLDFLLSFKLDNLINRIFGRTLKEDYNCIHVIHGTRNVWLLFFFFFLERRIVAGCREELSCIRSGWWGSRTQEGPRDLPGTLRTLFLYHHLAPCSRRLFPTQKLEVWEETLFLYSLMTGCRSTSLK